MLLWGELFDGLLAMFIGSAELAALSLLIAHFGVPLVYYLFLRILYLGRVWGVRADPGYTPRVVIIVPTFNEAGLIERKLEDLARQDYPRDRFAVIVVDSASSDGTPEIVLMWARNRDLDVMLVREPHRLGKSRALNTAFRRLGEGFEIVVVSDADSYWPDPTTLRRAVSYLADPSVGAVSCLKKPSSEGPAGVEEGYRGYYNFVRAAESKIHSTPVFHGELAAFRRSLLEKLGGFPEDLGADDSHTATLIAIRGYRAITPEDIWCSELVPRRGYLRWRLRRAQHLVQHFIRSIPMIPKAPRPFRYILALEAYLHLGNPWLLMLSAPILLASAALGETISLAVLLLGTALLVVRPYRTWVVQQAILVLASLRNIVTRELVWGKEEKDPTERGMARSS